MTADDQQVLDNLDCDIAALRDELKLHEQWRLDFYQERGITPPEVAQQMQDLCDAAISKETIRVMRGGAIKAPEAVERERVFADEVARTIGTFFSNAVPVAAAVDIERAADGTITSMKPRAMLNGLPVTFTHRTPKPREMSYVLGGSFEDLLISLPTEKSEYPLDSMRNIKAVWVEEDGGVAAKNKEIAALEAKFAARYSQLTGANTSPEMLPSSLSWINEMPGSFLAPPEEKKEPTSPEEPARKIRFREFL